MGFVARFEGLDFEGGMTFHQILMLIALFDDWKILVVFFFLEGFWISSYRFLAKSLRPIPLHLNYTGVKNV